MKNQLCLGRLIGSPDMRKGSEKKTPMRLSESLQQNVVGIHYQQNVIGIHYQQTLRRVLWKFRDMFINFMS